MGFWGPYYKTDVGNTGVELMEGSITVATSGGWKAYGLVRNDQEDHVGGIVVKAVLHNKDGVVLDEVTAESPVGNLRPGEPAPFAVHSSVEASDVAEVKWSVTWGRADQAVSRDLLLQKYYELPYGVSTDHGVARNDDPYPYVLAAGVKVMGRPIRNATLIAAWVDAQDKVITVGSTELFGAVEHPRIIAKGGAGNFNKLLVTDPEIGVRIGEDLTAMYWVVGK